MYSSSVDQYYPESTNTYTPEGNSAGLTTLSNGNEYTFVITGKIMVVAIVVFFIVVLFVICLHMYAEWIFNDTLDVSQGGGTPAPFFSFWARRHGNSADGQVVVNGDELEIHAVAGLDKSVLEALSTFRYKIVEQSASSATGIQECAICLVNFEEDDLGRSLPRCGHSFHLQCIDMWLDSHTTCPLCRVELEPDEELESQQADSETTGISEFHVESLVASRRLQRGELFEQNIPTQAVRSYQMNERSSAEQLPETVEDLQLVQIAQGQEADKRIDLTPSDTHQQLNEDPTLSAALKASSSQVTIDINSPPATYQHVQAQQHAPSDGMPNSSPPSSPLFVPVICPMFRTVSSFLRLPSRGGLLPASTATADTLVHIQPNPLHSQQH
ncbi:uncharacterized protein [Physcomitrium patens]|uniref:RING-type E3 ubiquitin transferase n=1 Tax=Physcomitrium patens TaxID=3218 RepID=A0A2K1KQG7_PHYPA|nr:RING-H2 finger protein ATL43-like [Physcomitrium patens]PNR56042.1 hypothetical protein PHYPA_006939 [Physcomitrium patens]|eukprot:XP_024373555.1 RING-H2 finger protein ATL43-like [Physcomitrella patens]